MTITGAILAALAAAALLLSGPGTRSWMGRDFKTGLLLFAGALVIGLLALVISGVARPRTRPNRTAAASAIAGAVIVLVPLVQIAAVHGKPSIHDVSTDLADPPRFSAVLPLRAGFPNKVTDRADDATARARSGPPIPIWLRSNVRSRRTPHSRKQSKPRRRWSGKSSPSGLPRAPSKRRRQPPGSVFMTTSSYGSVRRLAQPDRRPLRLPRRSRRCGQERGSDSAVSATVGELVTRRRGGAEKRRDHARCPRHDAPIRSIRCWRFSRSWFLFVRRPRTLRIYCSPTTFPSGIGDWTSSTSSAFVDDRYQLWASRGLDYSTHSAFAASLATSISRIPSPLGCAARRSRSFSTSRWRSSCVITASWNILSSVCPGSDRGRRYSSIASLRLSAPSA